jgi:dihydroxyacetone kinase
MIYAFLARHWRALAIVLAVLALYAAFRWYVASEVEQARQADAAAAAKVDAIADDVAGQVAASQAATTEQENRDARQAAADSDDPLRAGLDRLRAGKTGSR